MWLWWIDFMLAAGAAVVVVFVIVLNARDEYGLNFRSWLGAPNRISERPPRGGFSKSNRRANCNANGFSKIATPISPNCAAS